MEQRKGVCKSASFFEPICEYGWENFIHEIVAKNLTEEAACEMEKKLIESYDTTDDRHGYNQLIGGKTKEGRNNPMYGKSRPDLSNRNLNGGHPIAQYDKDEKLIKVYPSIRAAAREIKGHKNNIYNVLNGYSQFAYGYKWKLVS